MKILNTVLPLLILGASLMNAEAAKGLYSLQATDNQGKPAKLAQYEGKVALVVNTASECGYTPQYKGLQAVYEKYKSRGLVVLGFPSNDYGAQEPGSDAEIKTFCERFRVSFPLFQKNPVKGATKQPVYKFLTEKGPESTRGEVKWNFTKFLVGKDGAVLARFESAEEPDSEKITREIERLLP